MNENFKSLFTKKSIIIKKNIVIGLSGGPDSMFLLMYVKSLQNYNNYFRKVIPVIVDHKLRKESSIEAAQTKMFCSELGFNSKIIKINEKYNSGNLQNWARLKRREILYEYAQKYSADIMLGHQQDDQLETIFMRLLKSSGFEGLVGIREFSIWKDVRLIRPLIKIKKKQILNFLDKNLIPYVTDESNKDFRFERVKARKKLKLIQQNKFKNLDKNLLKLSKISKRLSDYFNKCYNNWSISNVNFYSHGSISINYNETSSLFEKNQEFCAYFIGKLIKNVSGNIYSPRKIKLIIKLNQIFKNKIQKFTISNAIIFKKMNRLNVIRENRNIDENIVISKANINFFDDRFLVLSKYDGKLILCENKKIDIVNFSNCNLFSKYSKLINYSLPKLKTLEGRIIKPYLYIIERKDITNHIKKKSDYDLLFIRD